MSLSTTGSVLVVFLWSLTGVQVQYNGNQICALKGSSVDLLCPIIYPTWAQVTEKVWYITELCGEPYDLRWDPKYEGRVEYLGTKEDDCSLRITDLRETDEETYQFRYKTNSGWIVGSYRYTLTLTELKVNVSETWSKTLTCSTTCTLPGTPTYNWYKNGMFKYKRTSSMYSKTVYNQDAGSYYCAVKSSPGLHSPAVCVHDSNCWSVTYTKRRMCVLTGSTVNISCTYNHPSSYIEQGSFWFTKEMSNQPFDFSSNSQYKDRVSYNRKPEKQKHTLTIRGLTERDSDEYKFRLLTDKNGRFKGIPGVILTVTGVMLLMDPTSVSEGGRVTLLCRTTCPLDHIPEYIWYKNGKPVNNTVTSYNRLILDPVTSTDEGIYFCAVKGHDDLRSLEKTLTVRYALRTRVSVSPSGEIVEGSSVTLTCSSDATPPVNKYTWYKKTVCGSQSKSYVNTGPQHVFNQVHSSDTAEYYCTSFNKEGTSTSMSVHVNVKYKPKNTSVSVSPSGEIVEGSSVTLTCSSDANPPVDKYTWYKKNVTSSKASGQNYSITNIRSEDSGEYYCEAENKYGHLNSSTVSVDVQYGPRMPSVSVSPSGEIVEGSSVTLTCSSDANPPVNKYTWYKKNVTLPKASGQSYNITNIRSEDSGEYYCEVYSKIASKKSNSMMLTVAGTQTTVMTAFVGVTVFLLVLICFSGFMCFRRKASKSTSDTINRDTADYGQGDSSPVYDNISSMEMTSNAAQRADKDNQEDLHYSSVHFSSSKNQEVPLYCTIQQSEAKEQEEDVQYAAVKFKCPSAAPSETLELCQSDHRVLGHLSD
ncbi:hypothetical protein UPYG_G00060250 [Umbra pygmaea]|uniref:B-cell receptor CD22 n=1 Tax=Umbra pygmaea TaxID=75934 RepID=A0ABD0X966_UMBPY